MKQKIVGTGLSGLVGSRVVELLGQEYEFEDISRKTGTDILDADALTKRLQNSHAEIVVHMAAYTNVDEAEKDKDLKEESVAWKLNVLGTKNVAQACEELGKHLLYISTDMVFPGTKQLPDRYSEEDATGPVGWYATTKAEAEKIVVSATNSWTILRIAYPYHMNVEKKGYVLIFKSLLEQGKNISAVADHFFTPTFIDDLADVLRLVCNKKLSGIYHVGGKDSVSPYEVAVQVAEVFGLNKNLITKTTREEYFSGKAPRAFNLSLDSGKIEQLGIRMKGLGEGLAAIKQQLQ